MISRYVVSIFLSSLLLIAVGCSGCVQSDFRELKSPDGHFLLRAKETDCAATDPYGTTITIWSSRPRLGIGWLGFQHMEIFAADVPMNETSMVWNDSRNIEISCIGCERYGVATKVETWDGIQIHFNVGNAQKGVF